MARHDSTNRSRHDKPNASNVAVPDVNSPSPLAVNEPETPQTTALAVTDPEKDLTFEEKLANDIVAGEVPAFVRAAHEFREELFKAMPGMARKLVRFINATPDRFMTKSGEPVDMVPSNVNMTKEQIVLVKEILGKVIPALSAVDMRGRHVKDYDRMPPAPPVADNKPVQITINQVGHTPDYHKVPGTVDGINVSRGEAKPMARLTFTDQTGEVILESDPYAVPASRRSAIATPGGMEADFVDTFTIDTGDGDAEQHFQDSLDQNLDPHQNFTGQIVDDKGLGQRRPMFENRVVIKMGEFDDKFDDELDSERKIIQGEPGDGKDFTQ